jgi:hypothetical protein
MRRGLWVGLIALLAACYAEAATHSVALDNVLDGGVEPADDAALDGEPEDPLDSQVVADSSVVTDAGDARVDAGCICTSPRKVCLPDKSCVECAKKEDCSDGKSCLVANNTCVECLDDKACAGNAAASVCNLDTHRCEPCTDGADMGCRMVTGKSVCKAGSCVECTQAKRTACQTEGAQPAVCDAALNTCTKRGIDSTVVCGECLSDDECAGDSACVGVAAAGVGKKVCQPIFRTGTTICARPYTKLTPDPVVTADGQSLKVCTLSGSTCKAFSDYRNTAVRCGTPASAPNEALDLAGSGDNARCGLVDQNDGYCVRVEAQGRYYCTVACSDAALDCPPTVSDVKCLPTMHSSGTASLCTL